LAISGPGEWTAERYIGWYWRPRGDGRA
jgi:hypothetical protein